MDCRQVPEQRRISWVIITHFLKEKSTHFILESSYLSCNSEKILFLWCNFNFHGWWSLFGWLLYLFFSPGGPHWLNLKQISGCTKNLNPLRSWQNNPWSVTQNVRADFSFKLSFCIQTVNSEYWGTYKGIYNTYVHIYSSISEVFRLSVGRRETKFTLKLVLVDVTQPNLSAQTP